MLFKISYILENITICAVPLSNLKLHSATGKNCLNISNGILKPIRGVTKHLKDFLKLVRIWDLWFSFSVKCIFTKVDIKIIGTCNRYFIFQIYVANISSEVSKDLFQKC